MSEREMRRLGDVCEKITDYVASGSFAALKENVLITNEENYALMVKTADFSNGFTKGLTYTDKHGYDFLRNSNLFGGELILSNIGSIGKVFKVPYLNRPMTLASNSVMIKTATDTLRDYLYYFFLSKAGYEKLLSISSGTSMKKFNKTELKKLEVPIPNTIVQQHIVSTLDTIQSLITHRKQQLEKLYELVKARFVEMFGDPVANSMEWDSKPMAEVAPSKPYKGIINGDVWLLNLDMIESQTGRIIDYIYVDKSEIGNSTSMFDEGNVLYSKLRPYLNKVVIPNKKGYATTELVPLRPNELLSREFLAYLLRSDSFVSYINEKVAGAKMPRVSMDAFREFKCILPPIELQNQFADFVKQVEKSKAVIQKSLDKSKMLFDSLMQEYFG